QLQGFDPAGNHAADREFGRLATLVGAVEHGAVNQGAVVVGTHLVVAGGLGAFAGNQHFVLQAGFQHGHAFTLGILGQIALASFGGGGGLGIGGGLHALADHLEAGVQVLGADLAGVAGKGIAQAGDDGVQASAGGRVVVQLFTDLAADAVADTGFVGGKVEL